MSPNLGAGPVAGSFNQSRKIKSQVSLDIVREVRHEAEEHDESPNKGSGPSARLEGLGNDLDSRFLAKSPQIP